MILNPNSLVQKIAKILSKIDTIFIFNKEKRRKEIEDKYKTQIFGHQVIKKAKEIGEGFWCGGFSTVTKNTILKDHVCFNGMKIMGGGNVTIGRYFHSGIEVLIITQNHNYDKGLAIPYDDTYTYKDVEIGDFVWIGSRVMILPGKKLERAQ